MLDFFSIVGHNISEVLIFPQSFAYWNKFSRPSTSPKYDLGFDFWWFDRDKEMKIGNIEKEGDNEKKLNQIL